MPKFISKVSKFGGQYRLTIPRGLIEECKWDNVEFVILERIGYDEIRLKRFIDRESLGVKSKKPPNG